MADIATASGDLDYFDRIDLLLKQPSCKQTWKQAPVQEIRFVQEKFRKLDVDAFDDDGGLISIHGEPQDADEFSALTKFGHAQIIAKRDMAMTHYCIFKDHANQVNEKIANLDPEIQSNFERVATKQIELSEASVRKIVAYQNLDEDTKMIIAPRLSDGLASPPEDVDVIRTGLLCHQYWRKLIFNSRIISDLEGKTASYSKIVCKTQTACLEAYQTPSLISIKNAANSLTELVMSSFGWGGSQSRQGGPSPYV